MVQKYLRNQGPERWRLDINEELAEDEEPFLGELGVEEISEEINKLVANLVHEDNVHVIMLMHL